MHKNTIESITGMVHQIEMEKTSYKTENLKLKVMVQSQECLKNCVTDLIENLMVENEVLFEVESFIVSLGNKELQEKLSQVIKSRAAVLATTNQRMQVISELRSELEENKDLQCQHYDDDFVV